LVNYSHSLTCFHILLEDNGGIARLRNSDKINNGVMVVRSPTCRPRGERYLRWKSLQLKASLGESFEGENRWRC